MWIIPLGNTRTEEIMENKLAKKVTLETVRNQLLKLGIEFVPPCRYTREK